MRLHFAGAVEEDDACITNVGGHRLFSYLNERGSIKDWRKYASLMVDSGAHTWNIFSFTRGTAPTRRGVPLPDIKDHAESYFQFIKSHLRSKIIFVELDTYAVLDKAYIDDMYKRVMDLGGDFQFIRVYHPYIDSGSLDEFNKWVEEGQTYIGVGNDSSPVYRQLFLRSRTEIRIHGFAMTKEEETNLYPFYSIDSTSWKAGVRYGKIVSPRSFQMTYDRYNVLEQGSFVLSLCVVNNKFNMNNVKSMKDYEEYVTELWRRRGVEWQ